MWYLAEILLAEPSQPDRSDYQCESCDVVFRADSAADVYRKAMAWGRSNAAEPPGGMQLLGVSHLTTIGEVRRLFEATAVWDRVGEFVPPPDQLKAIRWEQGQDVPVGELLNPGQIAQLKRRWGQES